MKEAMERYGVSSGSLNSALTYGYSTGGYHFYRADEPKPDDSFFKSGNGGKGSSKKRPVICLETGVQFESAIAALKWLDSGKTNNRGNMRTALISGSALLGYHFYYADEPKPPNSHFKRAVYCEDLDTVFTSLETCADAIGFNGSISDLADKVANGTVVKGHRLGFVGVDRKPLPNGDKWKPAVTDAKHENMQVGRVSSPLYGKQSVKPARLQEWLGTICEYENAVSKPATERITGIRPDGAIFLRRQIAATELLSLADRYGEYLDFADEAADFAPFLYDASFSTRGAYLKVSSPGNIYREAGFPQDPFFYTYNHLRDALVPKGFDGLFTVGRVQTPTLGLVVKRDEAIAHHVTRKFYELFASGDSDAGELTFKYLPGKELLAGEKHLFERHTLEALKEKLDGRDLHFETTVSKKQENPPLPYNLTVLLSDMSERFGFTAAETQQITQDLRDKYKAITYNRSDSQYLKEEHREQAPAVLAQAMKNLGVRWPLDYRLHSKAFNDGNVTAHHGIIPQEADAPVSAMEPDEAKVYTAICERYAVQFLPPAVYDVSESTVSVDGGTLKLTAKRLSDAGFTAVFPNISNSRVREDSDTGNPWVPAGSHTLAGISCSITEGETTPPAPYTEGTLITDMASIAKYVKDPEIREILKRKDDGKKGEHGGIGTTATRSSIIEGLKTRGYLEERKGKVRATDKAKAFYALLPPEIRGADVTARWWLIQQDIADGKADVNALQDSVIEVFNHHRETAYVGASIAGAGKTVVGKCPRCGKDVIKTGSIYACSSIKNEKQEDGTWKEVAGCGFKLFGFCTKKFTEKQAASLLDGKAVSLRGCKSKAGKTFDCTVVLQKDGSVEPIFTPRKPTKKGRR